LPNEIHYIFGLPREIPKSHNLMPDACYLGMTDSTRAFDLIQRLRPALFLTDIMMPSPDGFDLIRAVQSDPSLMYTRIAVMATTLYPNSQHVRQLTGMGVLHWLTLPYKPEDLPEFLYSVLLDVDAVQN
jgi:CheY-like chemotaxis protein